MTDKKQRYELPKKIDHYLATLAKLYAQEGHREKEEIIVNAQIRVQEEWSYDNWNGGTTGHALFLTLPEALYLGLVRKREDLQTEIRKDLNKIHNCQSEFIEEIFIEMEEVEDQDWRRKSGLLQSGTRVILPDAANRAWGDSGYRVFLSHKAEVKKKTAELKDGLAVFGVSCFVAHEDIHPTKEWQEEIENALMSMDAFVALMTDNFHDSDWTDQEVGYALGRLVPLIAVKLGKNPYGFIAKFQALSCSWIEAPIEIAKLLIRQPRMLDAYIAALPKCRNYDEGITLSQALPNISKLTDEQATRMVTAFNEDPQLRGSWGFNGGRPSMYGNGLAPHLSRATGHKYVITDSGTIERKKR